MALDNNAKPNAATNEHCLNRVLESLARLLGEHRADIIDANGSDLAACPQGDMVIYDRLKVDDAKIDRMIASIEHVIALSSPAGSIISAHTRTDGLRIENRRVPFGTILIIFEARPDVCIEAAIIALKAGNRILLKGGKEARGTNLALSNLWQLALEENGVDPGFVRYLDLTRDETRALISGEADKFDLVIPRGGEALIDLALKNSKAPVLVSGRGNNFLFIDAEADLDMALKIAIDGKSRLSVCNALDKVLLHRELPGLDSVITKLAEGFSDIGVTVFGDETASSADPSAIRPVESEEVWYEEFLSAKIVIGVAENLGDAIETINKYSGGHSAAIISANAAAAERFMREVDSAAVYHNASTRFTDGGEFGLGAEIAISTQKLHFRGPLGVEHLLTNKWFVYGNGQVRG
ncbi:MAG: glutamate-5-semialdehyde dehydrogenase [Acidobacteria bacterium]|nr:glutamate-5-semialdehyde dehydrogenase [Acidobacteriota bacterium]